MPSYKVSSDRLISPPTQWISLWMNAYPKARSMRLILHFGDLPKNEAAIVTSLKSLRQNG
jgi:hypothetical protein